MSTQARQEMGGKGTEREEVVEVAEVARWRAHKLMRLAHRQISRMRTVDSGRGRLPHVATPSTTTALSDVRRSIIFSNSWR